MTQIKMSLQALQGPEWIAFCISTPTLQAGLFHDLGVIYSRMSSKRSSWTSAATGRSMHHNERYFL